MIKRLLVVALIVSCGYGFAATYWTSSSRWTVTLAKGEEIVYGATDSSTLTSKYAPKSNNNPLNIYGPLFQVTVPADQAIKMTVERTGNLDKRTCHIQLSESEPSDYSTDDSGPKTSSTNQKIETTIPFGALTSLNKTYWVKIYDDYQVATYGLTYEQTYRVTFRYPAAAQKVTNLTLEQKTVGGTDGILVKWAAGTYATKYQVWKCCDNTNSGWCLEASVEDGSCEYFDTDVVDGYTFDYRIVAGNDDLGWSSTFTGPVEIVYSEQVTGEYSISYALDKGTKGTSSPESATLGSVFCVSAPTKTGYTFAGWRVSSGLNTSSAKWGKTSSPSTAISGSATTCYNGATGDVYFRDLTATAGSSVTLQAQWKANSYSVSYDLAEGSYGSKHPTSATFGNTFCVSAPTRTDYKFLGWTVTSGLNSSTAGYGSTSTL